MKEKDENYLSKIMEIWTGPVALQKVMTIFMECELGSSILM
jgi:hypothetical protein